jgi:hypothetical protein
VGRGLLSQRYNIMSRIALTLLASSLILVALLFSPVRFS